MISPEIEKFSNKVEIDANIIGKFLSHKILVFVEDKNRGYYYTRLLKELYPKFDKKISIVDVQKGKNFRDFGNRILKVFFISK